MPHLFRSIHSLVLVLLFIVFATGQERPKQYMTIQMLDSPAAFGSGEPNLYASADGRIYLSWIERSGEKGQSLRFAVRSGTSWSEPQTIAEGANWFVNWADF